MHGKRALVNLIRLLKKENMQFNGFAQHGSLQEIEWLLERISQGHTEYIVPTAVRIIPLVAQEIREYYEKGILRTSIKMVEVMDMFERLCVQSLEYIQNREITFQMLCDTLSIIDLQVQYIYCSDKFISLFEG